VESDRLPDPLRTFLLENVATYEQLESLLLLVEHPEERWEPSTVAARAGMDETLAKAALDHLSARGLLQEEHSRFHFAPQNDVLREQATYLLQIYRQSRLAVISTMSANALERVRLAGIRTFAEAFRLRGNKGHG
jgi:DNA-binding MarR family transcriptional regulator